MAYVAVKGGERAIDAAHAWLAEERRGDPAVPDVSLAQIDNQLGRAVDRVMAEGSLYDRGLAALAVKQAQGDLIEAAFLLRAFRATLPRFAHSLPVETGRMQVRRRISAIFKDVPGGQVLGPTCDYTHRLLDFALADSGEPPPRVPAADAEPAPMPLIHEILGQEGLIEADPPLPDAAPGDLTREPLSLPASANIGEAYSRGLEFESTIAFTRHIAAKVGYTYDQTKITSYDTAYLNNATIPPAAVGSPLPGTPKNSVSLALEYAHAKVGDGELRYALDANYRSTILPSDSSTVPTVPGYTMLNGLITYTQSNWLATVYVNNIANVLGINAYTDPTFYGNRYQAVVSQPRTAGVRFGYSFKGW